MCDLIRQLLKKTNRDPFPPVRRTALVRDTCRSPVSAEVAKAVIGLRPVQSRFVIAPKTAVADVVSLWRWRSLARHACGPVEANILVGTPRKVSIVTLLGQEVAAHVTEVGLAAALLSFI